MKRAALQSPGKGGPGIFDIASRTGWFDAAGVIWTKEAGRPAHVYVFAWNGGLGSAADHRDCNQWEFFVIPALYLPVQKTLRLSRLKVIPGIVGPFTGPERCAEALRPYEQKVA